MNRSHPAIARMTAVFLGFCLSLVFIGSPLAAEYASVNSNGVNVRCGPSTNDQVRWEVFKDFPLEVLKRENGWVNCRDFEGDQGWVYEQLLSNKKTVIVRKSKVNLREEPTTDENAKIVALVKYGVVFDAIAKDGDWLKVKHADGTEGWIHKDLVWPSDPLD